VNTKDAPRTGRWVSRLSLIAWAVDLLLILASLVVGGAGGDIAEGIFFLPAALLYSTLGSQIVVRQRGNAIGWILLLAGTGLAVEAFANPLVPILIDGGSEVGRYVAWVADWAFIPTVGPLALIFLLFPDGKPPSGAWRKVGWVIVGSVTTAWIAFALTPGPLNSFQEIQSPVAISGAGALLGGIVAAATIVAMVASFSTAFAVRSRYKRSVGEERQQIRWLAAVATLAGIFLVAWVVTIFVASALGREGEGAQFDIVLIPLALLALTIGIGVPVAVALAIFRYRLWDLDFVVKKTAQYGVLVAGFTVVVGFVVLLVPFLFVRVVSDVGRVPVIVMGVLLASGFSFVRARGRHWADRIVYGKRSTPYEVLSEFAERVGGTYSSDDVLPRMAQLLGEATGARTARVWLRIGEELRAETVWPHEAPPVLARRVAGDALPDLGEDEAFEVRHQGELLGALTLTVAANDPMNPTKAKLARDMAAQAGLVLRNVRLIEDLRDSRRRIVSAQDERARALERNIHDGAQQQLVALSVQLRLAESMVDRDPAKARALLTDLQSRTVGTLEDLRDLARGIYPPLLADKGLPAALEAQARKSPLPVTIHPDGVGRFRDDVESAVYFCCLEALNNVAKYAEASTVQIRLEQATGELRFEVADDGRGFDTSATGHGTGLQGMADRLEAIGGRLEVRSSPGRGTSLAGSIPLAQGARA
jgi:signal transduction histidine kinase